MIPWWFGAWRDDDNGPDSGSVYLFTRPDSGWVDSTEAFETSKLVASDSAAGDRFGGSAAVDGGSAVVGAYKDDVDGVGVDSGSVYVVGIPDWTDIPGSGAATTMYTVTGLTNAVEHTYQIRAVYLTGAALASYSASAVPMPKARPTDRAVHRGGRHPGEIGLGESR